MIHLFNKIYLKGEHQFKASRDRIVISPTYAGLPVATEVFTSVVNGEKQGISYYEARTYDELIANAFGGNEQSFFDFLLKYSPTKRLTIYCSFDAMLTILTKFLKTLHPQMSADVYKKIITLTFRRTANVYGSGFMTFLKLRRDHADDYRTQSLNIVADDANLHTHWETATPWQLVRADKELIVKGSSVEYQLLTLFVNPTWHHRGHVEAKIVRMMKKQLIHELTIDLKHALLNNFPSLNKLVSSTDDIVSMGLEAFVSKHSQFKFLLDDDFTPDCVEHVYNTYDIESLGNLYKQVCLQDKLVDLTLFKRDLTLDDIITGLQNSTPINSILTRGEFEESINPYMVDFIVEQIKRNDLSILSQMRLG